MRSTNTAQEFVLLHRFGDRALPIQAAHRGQHLHLPRVLDAFCRDFELESSGDIDDRFDYHAALRLTQKLTDEMTIYPDLGERHLRQQFNGRNPRTEVVNRQAQSTQTQAIERSRQLQSLLRRLFLRYADDDK